MSHISFNPTRRDLVADLEFAIRDAAGIPHGKMTETEIFWAVREMAHPSPDHLLCRPASSVCLNPFDPILDLKRDAAIHCSDRSDPHAVAEFLADRHERLACLICYEKD